MADFCQQCSIEIFGEDNRDLAGLGKPNLPLPPNTGYSVICEGCGVTTVDRDGRCLLHDHDGVEAKIHQEIGI